jgi:hypothetical protein
MKQYQAGIFALISYIIADCDALITQQMYWNPDYWKIAN